MYEVSSTLIYNILMLAVTSHMIYVALSTIIEDSSQMQKELMKSEESSTEK